MNEPLLLLVETLMVMVIKIFLLLMVDIGQDRTASLLIAVEEFSQLKRTLGPLELLLTLPNWLISIKMVI